MASIRVGQQFHIDQKKVQEVMENVEKKRNEQTTDAPSS